VLRVSVDGPVVRVWDARVVDMPPLVFTLAEWDAFVEGARLGEFDFAPRVSPMDDSVPLDDDEP
jgi:hypothetical protein